MKKASTILTVLAVLLCIGPGCLSLVGCGSPHASDTAPTARPCVIVERKTVLGTHAQPDPERSPPHCTDEVVLQNYREAMQASLWYRPQPDENKCPPVAAPTAYPPRFLETLGRYYVGELLHETRESIYHNQQAGRIVLGCWDWSERSGFSGLIWAADGRSVTVRWNTENYHLLTYQVEQGFAHLQDDHPSGGAWNTTMVYDEQDERWKIQQAENLFSPGNG